MPHTVRRALAIVTIMAVGLLPGAAPALSAPLVMEPAEGGGGYLSLGGAWDNPCQENGGASVKSGNSVGVFKIGLPSYGPTAGSNSPLSDYDRADISVCGTLLPATSALPGCTDYIVRPEFAQGELDLVKWGTSVGETVQLSDIDFRYQDTQTAWSAMVFQASAILADGRAVDVRAALHVTQYGFGSAPATNCWGLDGYKSKEFNVTFGPVTVTEAS